MKRLLVAAALVCLPLPALAQSDTTLIQKGRTLFNDTRLSGSGLYSCASCHPVNGHTDNKTYVGVEVVADGDPKGRSTPTLWGAGERHALWSWAGTVPTIEANIRGIIVNRMKGKEPSAETLDALAAYTRSLPYGPAPFLDKDGLPRGIAQASVKRGYALFFGKAGCKTCHIPPSYDSKDVEDVGSGGTFKVPSLRSVAKTAPYFHDGRFKTLDEAVSFMSDAYVKKTANAEQLTDAEKRDIVEFLKAL